MNVAVVREKVGTCPVSSGRRAAVESVIKRDADRVVPFAFFRGGWLRMDGRQVRALHAIRTGTEDKKERWGKVQTVQTVQRCTLYSRTTR